MAKVSHLERLNHVDRWSASIGFLIVNRLQILYFILFIPQVMVFPYKIWVIPMASLVSHLNLWLLSIWLQTQEARCGHDGFVQLFGNTMVRVFAFIGIITMLLKCNVLTLGYIRIIQHVLFPTMGKQMLLFLIWLAGIYLAGFGMILTGRFAMMAFVGSIWMILLYIQFFMPVNADYIHLFPLIPQQLTTHTFTNFLILLAAMSGPEFLAFCGKRFDSSIHRKELFRAFALGNTVTLIEYMMFFVASLVFFGPEYLQLIDFPIVQMIRYIELPFFERMEMIMLSLYMLPFVFLNAFFLVHLYDAIRIVTNRVKRTRSKLGQWMVAFLYLISMYIFSKYLWKTEIDKIWWIKIYVWVFSMLYVIVPAFLVLVTYWKKKRKVGE